MMAESDRRERTPSLPADPSPLIAYLHGEISIDELPSQIRLPQTLWQQMNDLWQRSITEIDRGVVREWGGVLILDSQGRLRLVRPVAGTAGQVRIARSSVRDAVVGSFHTHPYPDGTTGIGFSGRDIADTINGGRSCPCCKADLRCLRCYAPNTYLLALIHYTCRISMIGSYSTTSSRRAWTSKGQCGTPTLPCVSLTVLPITTVWFSAS